jgi:hypothetical protein
MHHDPWPGRVDEPFADAAYSPGKRQAPVRIIFPGLISPSSAQRGAPRQDRAGHAAPLVLGFGWAGKRHRNGRAKGRAAGSPVGPGRRGAGATELLYREFTGGATRCTMLDQQATTLFPRRAAGECFRGEGSWPRVPRPAGGRVPWLRGTSGAGIHERTPGRRPCSPGKSRWSGPSGAGGPAPSRKRWLRRRATSTRNATNLTLPPGSSVQRCESPTASIERVPATEIAEREAAPAL